MADTDTPETNFDSGRLKRFVLHLASAAKRVEESQVAKEEIQEHVAKLKEAVQEDQTPKKDLAPIVKALESSLKTILKNEELILKSQQLESKTVSDLKSQVDKLTQKLIGVGKEYSEQLDDKDIEIEDLKARVVMHESNTDDRRDRLARVEAKIKAHHSGKKHVEINEMSERLLELEKTHKKLVKEGKHPKTHLNRLKKIIDSHKKKINTLK